MSKQGVLVIEERDWRRPEQEQGQGSVQKMPKQGVLEEQPRNEKEWECAI